MLVTALFVTASCMATTPQKSYVAEMQPALELLEEWQNDYDEIEILLTEPLDSATGITRLQLIEFYNIATEEYQITRDEYSKVGLMPLDALAGPSINSSKDGQSILKILSSVTPMEEIQADHQAVVDCVQTRVGFADELSSSIKDLNTIDMNKAGELVSCDTFDASLEKITAFVNENE